MVLTVDELDPATLTELLAASPLTGGARVVDLTSRPVGAGQVASCVELSLQVDGLDAPVAVVAKGPSSDPVSLATANSLHLYEREVRFYAELAATVSIRTPQCHHVSFDPVTGGFLLLLESLCPAGDADQLDGLSPERAARAVVELAGLHAPHWGDTSLSTARYVQDVGASLRPLYDEVLPALFSSFLERYGDGLDTATRAVVEWLAPRLGAYQADRDVPGTVLHGDFRTDNLLFDGRGGEVPMATVDWQTLGHGPGALDLAYLLTTSLTTEDRRRDEDELVARYLDALGALGVTGYDAASLAADYALHSFQGVVMLVCASMLVERTERGDAMFLTMIERCAAAVDDLGARALVEA